MIGGRRAVIGVALALLALLAGAAPAAALRCADPTPARDRVTVRMTSGQPRGVAGAVHVVLDISVPNVYVEAGAKLKITLVDQDAGGDVSKSKTPDESIDFSAGFTRVLERDFSMPVGHRYALHLDGPRSWLLLFGALDFDGPPLDRAGEVKTGCSAAAAVPMTVRADYAQDGEFRLYSALGSVELVNAPQCASCNRGQSSRRAITFSAYTGLRIKNYIALGVRDDTSPRADKLVVTDSILLSSGPQCANADPFRQIAIEPNGQAGGGTPCSSRD